VLTSLLLWDSLGLSRKGETKMVIQIVKNEYGEIVYHVEDEGCIQEFATKREAKEYIDYVKSLGHN